jgi:histidine decarboxylase
MVDTAKFPSPPFSHKLSIEDTDRLEKFFQQMQQEAEHFLGYPCNRLFDYSPIYRFLQFPLNNVGDPYLPSNIHLNTHEFECEVLAIFQQLTAAPANNTWGYVTNGSTEGNHYGLFLARELLPNGVVYYSQDSHYSIDKVLRCLNLSSIMIRSHPDGCMDLADLRETLRIHRDTPAIVCANIGTTMKGAIDDIAGIKQIFQELALPHHYIHADAALSGAILPFLSDPPPWNFQAGIDSISISGHKMIGAPIPCGIVLAKKSNVDRIAQSVEYIGTLDTTLSGSRNAFSPLLLWYAFCTVGFDGFQQIVPACLEVADYAIEHLNKIGLHAWRHPYSNTVVFDRPSPAITQQWQLACQGELSHLITMPHVTKKSINQLVQSILAAEPPVPKNHSNFTVTAIAADITLVGSAAGQLLQQVSQALAAAGISIRALAATEDKGLEVIRLRVDDRDLALQILNQTLDMGRRYGHAEDGDYSAATEILRQLDYQPVSEQSFLASLPDRVGSLAELLQSCQKSEVPIQGVRLLWQGQGRAVVAITTPEPDRLRALMPKEYAVNLG